MHINTTVFHFISSPVYQKSKSAERYENTTLSAAILGSLRVCICSDVNEPGLCVFVWQKNQIRHDPTFFCTSLEKSDLTRLRPEELKIQSQNIRF